MNERYAKLDIVVCDGAAFIARRDSPGIIGVGDGWQMMSRQGKPGRKGDIGERGPRGEKGEPGATFHSWQVNRERYAVSPLMTDGTVAEPPILPRMRATVRDRSGGSLNQTGAPAEKPLELIRNHLIVWASLKEMEPLSDGRLFA